MDVIVKIAGREALPVWTIPYITSWDISADMLLKRLVAPNYNNEPTFPDAFNLDSYGDPHSIPSIWWFDTETRISMLGDELTDEKISQYKKLDKWHKRSVEIIMQNTGCYIWLDEFKKWLESYNNYDNEILVKPTGNDRGFTTYRIELFLNPPLPPEHALYFKNTEIMELKAKAPLDKIDKDLLDARIIARGSPTLSLQNFIDRVLADAIGTKATLPTFYDLVEEHGLIVYDKVIDGQIVPSGELLDSLRQREQQVNQSFDDDSFQFWEVLAKESKYSILFNDVAMAYDRAGKSKFPWLNMDNIVDWLNIEEHVVGNAKPEAKQLDKLLIPYRKAKQSLDARLLKVTDDEIAMWVSGIDGACLDAYLVDYKGIPSRFTYDPRKFIRNDDYISPLQGLYFLPDDINRFQPAKRYISRPLLIERWAKLCDDPVNAIKHRAVDSNLFEYHPISGAVESDGKLYRSGLFDLGVVKKIESTHFPRSQLITNNSVDEQTAIVKKMFPTDKLYSAEQWQALTLTASITTQLQAEAATIKTDDGDDTATKRERAHTRWFRQTWVAEGKPPGETFFNRLKKYKN